MTAACEEFMPLTLAITVTANRISPVFDVARQLLLVDVENGSASHRRLAGLQGSEPTSRTRSVAALGIQVLICGAISHLCEDQLLRGGIELHARTCGEVEEVLHAFLSGKLSDDAFLMPGCRRGRNRQWGVQERRRRSQDE
jgi:predicted Fe-Mo cluster-binding NifX family protein